MKGNPARAGLMLTLGALAVSCATTEPGASGSSTAARTATAAHCDSTTASRIPRCDPGSVRVMTTDGLENTGFVTRKAGSASPPPTR